MPITPPVRSHKLMHLYIYFLNGVGGGGEEGMVAGTRILLVYPFLEIFSCFYVAVCVSSVAPDENVMAVAAGGAAVAGIGILLGALLTRR